MADSRASRPTLAAGAVCIDLAGQPLELLPQRAAFHRASATLLVADVHLGKAATFRALGVPVPAGTTQSTLRRLDTLVSGLPVRTLIILGDLLHSAHAHSAGVVDALVDWRCRHPKLQVQLVQGNHDTSAGALPPETDIETVHASLQLGSWRLRHAPADATEQAPWIAGHVHPVHRLAMRGDRLRLPAFWRVEAGLVLPAFGDFTGGWRIPPASARDSFVTDGERVYPLTPRAPA